MRQSASVGSLAVCDGKGDQKIFLMKDRLYVSMLLYHHVTCILGQKWIISQLMQYPSKVQLSANSYCLAFYKSTCKKYVKGHIPFKVLKFGTVIIYGPMSLKSVKVE